MRLAWQSTSQRMTSCHSSLKCWEFNRSLSKAFFQNDNFVKKFFSYDPWQGLLKKQMCRWNKFNICNEMSLKATLCHWIHELKFCDDILNEKSNENESFIVTVPENIDMVYKHVIYNACKRSVHPITENKNEYIPSQHLLNKQVHNCFNI